MKLGSNLNSLKNQRKHSSVLMILRLEPSSPVSGISVRVRMFYKTGKNPDTGTGTETLVPAANMNNSSLAEQYFFTS